MRYQDRVQDWMKACFSEEVCRDGAERNHRFLEEALELVQSLGCTASEAHQLVDYVYGRPDGDVNQEMGGVMVTLAALATCAGIDMEEAAERELARVWTKIEQIRAKQASKPKHSPLPQAVDSRARCSAETNHELKPVAWRWKVSSAQINWCYGEEYPPYTNSVCIEPLYAAPQPAENNADWKLIETAPRDGSKILATGGGLGSEVEIVSFNVDVGAWNTAGNTLDDVDHEPEGYSRPSHWMPRPVPPITSDYTDENVWPNGCTDVSSCAFHKSCMYERCRHKFRNIANEIRAALAAPQPAGSTLARPFACPWCGALYGHKSNCQSPPQPAASADRAAWAINGAHEFAEKMREPYVCPPVPLADVDVAAIIKAAQDYLRDGYGAQPKDKAMADQLGNVLRKYEALEERLGPRGLEVVMIDGAGHYVNEKIKAEIERLRASPAQTERMTNARIRSALQAAKDVLRGYAKVDYDKDNQPQPNWAFEVEQMCKEALHEIDEAWRLAEDGQPQAPAVTNEGE